MRILVTGADGFLGRGLVKALPAAFLTMQRLVLTDRAFERPGPPSSDYVCGNIGDADFLSALLEPGFDLVFHLASVPGSLAEREQEIGYSTNLLASLNLARGVAARCRGANFVFASSIAVYGALNGELVLADTKPAPLLTYGAHKLMTEIFLSDMARQGALSAISLRFPGIVARPPSESGHGSAFMSQIFHKVAAGEVFDCPIPAESTCWWMSQRAAVGMLLRAAAMSNPTDTVIQPPVLHASLAEVSQAIGHVVGKKPLIQWGSDVTLQRIFGSMPPLDAARASALGFCADANLETLANASLSGDDQ